MCIVNFILLLSEMHAHTRVVPELNFTHTKTHLQVRTKT